MAAMELSGLVVGTYLVVLLVLAFYGFHRSSLVWLYYRNRDKKPRPPGRFSELPAVTVQLPLFNEMYVVERLLDAVAGIRYPRDRFQVQVLDDSTDETQEICKRKIAELRARMPELDIEYVHRIDRTGFKAGALQNGLRIGQGRVHPDLRRRLPAAARHPGARGRPLHRPEGGGGAVPLGARQPRLLGADRGRGADARRALHHGARRPQLVGPLLQLQRHRRAVAAGGHRRRRRLAARHADRGHGPVVPGPAARLEVRLPARDRRAGRAAGRDVGLQVAAVPLGQGLGAGGEEAAADDPALERDLRAEVRGVLPPDQQPRLPAVAGAVAPAAAEPGAAHAPRLARGADDRPAAVLRDDAVGGVVLPGLAARDRADAPSRRQAAASSGGRCRGCRW